MWLKTSGSVLKKKILMIKMASFLLQIHPLLFSADTTDQCILDETNMYNPDTHLKQFIADIIISCLLERRDHGKGQDLVGGGGGPRHRVYSHKHILQKRKKS